MENSYVQEPATEMWVTTSPSGPGYGRTALPEAGKPSGLQKTDLAKTDKPESSRDEQKQSKGKRLSTQRTQRNGEETEFLTG